MSTCPFKKSVKSEGQCSDDCELKSSGECAFNVIAKLLKSSKEVKSSKKGGK